MQLSDESLKQAKPGVGGAEMDTSGPLVEMDTSGPLVTMDGATSKVLSL